MGMGIEWRYRKYSQQWASHLTASKAAQSAWLARTLAGGALGSVAILGAGRLYDCPLSELAVACRELHLCDADPLARRAWRSAARKNRKTRIVPHVFEFSGVLGTWGATLRRAGTWDEALDVLRAFGETGSGTRTPLERVLGEIRPDGIVSLNVLSQIPVMWQDLAEEYLVRRFGRGFVSAREADWLAAYLPGARRLAADHLRALNGSGARSILLITDLEYVDYSLASSAAPVSTPALADIHLENEGERTLHLPQYCSSVGESWLWEICPQREGRRNEGTRHRVGAFEFNSSS